MRKTYKVKEIFYSLQGEGYYSGTPFVFVRFSGCNLWSGLEKHKKDSPCWFCDTNFVGGESLTASEILERINNILPNSKEKRVVLTGGEPLLQVDEGFVEFLYKNHWSICIETNGTIDVDFKTPVWITVSPKTHDFKITKANEVKLLFENVLNPSEIREKFKFTTKYFYLQGIDNKVSKEMLDYILNNNEWRLSMQLHKILGIE